MKEPPLFWIGNRVAATLIEYATGKALAVITDGGLRFSLNLYIGRIDRIRFWRSLTRLERQNIRWSFFTCGLDIEFNSMREAIQEIDALLEALKIICPLPDNPARLHFAHC